MEQKRILLTPPFAPSLEQYKRSIRWESLDDAQEEALTLFYDGKDRLQPKVLVSEQFIDEYTIRDTLPSVFICNVLFKGKALKVLEKVSRVFVYVATCGDEMEGYDLSGADMLAPYWLDIIKSQSLKDARVALASYIREHYGISIPKSLNPGSGNVDIWPIEEQLKLFNIIGGANDIGVSLTDSCLMKPNKSLSGFMFASPTIDWESCAYCERENCPNRRVPFKELL